MFSVERSYLKPSWPLPRPHPRREGEWLPRYPCEEDTRLVLSLIAIYNSSNALWTLYAGGLLWARNCAPKRSVKSVSSVREKSPQRVVCMSSHREGAFYFSQKDTEEQNTQTFTETLSQPITQSVTANVSWKASVFSVCRRRSVGSKCAPKGSVNSVRSVREKPIHDSQVFSLSHRRTQKNRTHKLSQRH